MSNDRVGGFFTFFWSMPQSDPCEEFRSQDNFRQEIKVKGAWDDDAPPLGEQPGPCDEERTAPEDPQKASVSDAVIKVVKAFIEALKRFAGEKADAPGTEEQSAAAPEDERQDEPPSTTAPPRRPQCSTVAPEDDPPSSTAPQECCPQECCPQESEGPPSQCKPGGDKDQEELVKKFLKVLKKIRA